jgi:hypothetical protein
MDLGRWVRTDDLSLMLLWHMLSSDTGSECLTRRCSASNVERLALVTDHT